MKLRYIKQFIFVAAAMCAVTENVSAKEETIEVIAQELPALVALKCQQAEIAERLAVNFKSLMEWGSEWVNIKNDKSKGEFLEWLKAELDTLWGTIQDFSDAVGKMEMDKGLKKSYNQTLNNLRAFHKNGMCVYTLIQQYNNSIDFTALMAFGLKLRQYKMLLPKSVRDMGTQPAFKALKHRLTCKKLA